MNLIDQHIRESFGRIFAKKLKAWMKINSKTQKEFCAVAGISKNIVTAWKRGERLPRNAQIMKICEVFELDPCEFRIGMDAETDAEIEGGGSSWWYVCGECHTAIDTRDRFCRQCGRMIRWNNLKGGE